MTLKDAEKIVKEYCSVLAASAHDSSPHNGLANYLSRLPHSPERIVQAMKLRLANEIHIGFLAENFSNEIGCAASMLPYFIQDEKARRLNAIKRNWAARRSDLSNQELSELAKSVLEQGEWSTQAMAAGFSLRCKLGDFISTVKQFDPSDQLFWQRIYTLVGLQYPANKKRSFWDWFS